MNEFKVFIDDNFHSPDFDAPRYPHAVFSDYESAVARCKQIVDKWLVDALRDSPNLRPEQLMQQFAMFGDEPFVSPSPDEGGFRARDYAASRCEELCRG